MSEVRVKPDILSHHKSDNVAVVVVEGLESGSRLCVCIEDDSDFMLDVGSSIPIGHKVALMDLCKGDKVVKYGEDIGIVLSDIARGEHVHVHNLKTKRW